VEYVTVLCGTLYHCEIKQYIWMLHFHMIDCDHLCCWFCKCTLY